MAYALFTVSCTRHLGERPTQALPGWDVISLAAGAAVIVARAIRYLGLTIMEKKAKRRALAHIAFYRRAFSRRCLAPVIAANAQLRAALVRRTRRIGSGGKALSSGAVPFIARIARIARTSRRRRRSYLACLSAHICARNVPKRPRAFAFLRRTPAPSPRVELCWADWTAA